MARLPVPLSLISVMLHHALRPACALVTAVLLSGLATAQFGSLTTTYPSNNGRSTTPPVTMFDLTVKSASGAWITTLDINSMASAGTKVDIEVYVTQVGQTYLGNELNASAWTKVSEGSGTAQGRDNPTPVDIDDFVLAPGTYGFGVYYLNGGSAYTNGTGTNQNYSNADLAIAAGATTATFFSGTLFTPRVWNGTIYYFNGNAAYSTFGDGCIGSAGVPELKLAANGEPRIGGTASFEMANLPSQLPAFLGWGTSNKSWAGLSLPFDLTALGAPGCGLLTEILASQGVVPTGQGTGTASLPVPNNPSLVGLVLFNQGFVLDFGHNPLGLTVSNGGAAYLGN